MYQQDCSPGEKCSPYSGDGDDAWDSVKCVPVARDPGAPGEPCTVEGSPVSGIDSCDVGALCWHVDPDTLTGTCVAMCAGSPDAPICGPGLACHVDFDGVLNLCLPTCDPLLQDCEPGQLCIPSGAAFACLPAGAPDAPLFAPCEDLTTCAPGLHCAAPQLAPACDLMAPGCCLPYCDTAMPTCPPAMPTCPPALQCLPWYEPSQAPAGLEDLGLCGIAP